MTSDRGDGDARDAPDNGSSSIFQHTRRDPIMKTLTFAALAITSAADSMRLLSASRGQSDLQSGPVERRPERRTKLSVRLSTGLLAMFDDRRHYKRKFK
jgi:hypothetical protein